MKSASSAISIAAIGAIWASWANIGVMANNVSQPKNWNVIVGGAAGNVFTPPYIKANIGDTVTYFFMQKNHTVTQSSFAKPCALLQDNVSGRLGFDTGFVPVSPNATAFPTYTLTVTDNKPIWFYCKQSNHCETGMVGAINPPDQGNTLSAFKSLAAKVPSTDLKNIGSPFGGVGCLGNDAVRIPPPNAPPVTPYDIGASNGVPISSSQIMPGNSNNQGNNQGNNQSNNQWGTVRQIHKVVVGGPSGNVFTPNQIDANIGDIVQYEFQVDAHSVTQSSFGQPCQLLDDNVTGRLGFDTGIIPVAANTTVFPLYNLTVTSTTPIWFYCKASDHCPTGMVGVINVNKNSPNSLAAFTALAAKTTTSLNQIGSPFGGVGAVGSQVFTPTSSWWSSLPSYPWSSSSSASSMSGSGSSASVSSVSSLNNAALQNAISDSTASSSPSSSSASSDGSLTLSDLKPYIFALVGLNAAILVLVLGGCIFACVRSRKDKRARSLESGAGVGALRRGYVRTGEASAPTAESGAGYRDPYFPGGKYDTTKSTESLVRG